MRAVALASILRVPSVNALPTRKREQRRMLPAKRGLCEKKILIGAVLEDHCAGVLYTLVSG